VIFSHISLRFRCPQDFNPFGRPQARQKRALDHFCFLPIGYSPPPNTYFVSIHTQTKLCCVSPLPCRVCSRSEFLNLMSGRMTPRWSPRGPGATGSISCSPRRSGACAPRPAWRCPGRGPRAEDRMGNYAPDRILHTSIELHYEVRRTKLTALKIASMHVINIFLATTALFHGSIFELKR